MCRETEEEKEKKKHEIQKDTKPKEERHSLQDIFQAHKDAILKTLIEIQNSDKESLEKLVNVLKGEIQEAILKDLLNIEDGNQLLRHGHDKKKFKDEQVKILYPQNSSLKPRMRVRNRIYFLKRFIDSGVFSSLNEMLKFSADPNNYRVYQFM